MKVPARSFWRPLIFDAYILIGLTPQHILAREAENWVTAGNITVESSVTQIEQDESSISRQKTFNSLTSRASLSTTLVRPPGSTRLTADVAQFRRISSLAQPEATQVGATAVHAVKHPTHSSVGTAYLSARRWRSPEALLNFGEIESAASNGKMTQYKAGLEARQTNQLDSRHSAGLALGADQTQTRTTDNTGINRNGETSAALFLDRQQDKRSAVTLTARQNLSYVGPYQVRQVLGGRATRRISSLSTGRIGISRGRGAFNQIDGKPSWRGFWTADISGEYRTRRFSFDATVARSVARRPISSTVTIADQLSYYSRWMLTTYDALSLGASQSWERQILAEDDENFLGSSRQLSLESSHGLEALGADTSSEEKTDTTLRSVWQLNFTLRFAETKYVAKTTARTATIGLTRYF